MKYFIKCPNSISIKTKKKTKKKSGKNVQVQGVHLFILCMANRSTFFSHFHFHFPSCRRHFVFIAGYVEWQMEKCSWRIKERFEQEKKNKKSFAKKVLSFHWTIENDGSFWLLHVKIIISFSSPSLFGVGVESVQFVSAVGGRHIRVMIVKNIIL